ncbi:MAG TPA: hypothetical protein H9865_10290 [Candidatus Fournierella pullicola]|uniref:HEAT repeat domain-containing protein n=1 Tax=Candidatus Allofournierella pullicola TaxID=2838596 RepID=A0A9D1V5M3_9FIRM|nr:hypothetical protein [Candidatus Fournierella pullicola]
MEQLLTKAGNDPQFLDALFEIVRSEHSAVRYSCTKILRMLSERQPDKIYPYFDDVANWLRDSNSFVKWDGILTLANLASVDAQRRFASVYEEYFGLIRDSKMVTAANAAGNAWKIVQAVPEWESDITRRLLEVPQIVYLHHGEPSAECNRVMCGHVLDCFDHYFDLSKNQQAMICFARSQLNSSRKSVAKKAARFLKKHEI